MDENKRDQSARGASDPGFGEVNQGGWNSGAYTAWVRSNGTPGVLADKLKRDPLRKPAQLGLGPDEVRGRRIVNLLGSNGKLAVSLALLGAEEVTVVDLSADNARYALETARAAGVDIRYVVADVMAIPERERPADCHLAVMELGILHWIADLGRFFRLVAAMLREDGRMIVRDFHPIQRSLLKWQDGVLTASGHYFDNTPKPGTVPYAKLLSEEERKSIPDTVTRGWTMGQIITAVAEAGFVILRLEEESGPAARWMFPPDAPSGIEDRVPALYTLVAERTKHGQ